MKQASVPAGPVIYSIYNTQQVSAKPVFGVDNMLLDQHPEQVSLA